MLIRRGVFWMGLACCSLMAAAQNQSKTPGSGVAQNATPSGAAAQPSAMTFGVVVTNPDGKLVTGLKASDFTVLDNGRPTPIQSFATGAASPESVILMIDDINTDASDLMVAQQQIESFLKRDGGRLPVPVSVMLLTERRLSRIAPPSQDGNLLSSKVEKLSGLYQVIPAGSAYHYQDLMMTSLRGLLVLSAMESETPGRKLVIWVSHGWWLFDPDTSRSQQQHALELIMLTSEALRHAGITLDAIDPLGVKDVREHQLYIWKSFLKPVTRWQQAQPADLGLFVLAAQSGGQVEWGSNDVAGELKTCMDDAQASYSVSFAVPTDAQPGSWQDIEVKVDEPNVQVRTANGYYVAPKK